ncbi:MAG: hypothetical protein ISN29_09250 [Gammaproteobacteria bacterium AqS3]|nr:hypothetical protein [Gammaproteobacteria bacterium AqS3]
MLSIDAARLDTLRQQGQLTRRARRGIERESLRVTEGGDISMRDHPKSLGEPLVHPHITLDFGEAQIEWVSSVHSSIPDMLEQMRQLLAFTQSRLEPGRERLWGLSVPCPIRDEDRFLHAYSQDTRDTHQGLLAQLYRVGLRHRYGAMMQAVCGVHYNFSFPKALWPHLGVERNEGYLAAVRNVRRHLWSLIYLYGASPLVHPTFVDKRSHRLEPVGADALGLPGATSLRIGDLGYSSRAQDGMGLAFNSLESYTGEVERGLTTPWPAFVEIDRLGREAGRRLQISPAILQLENELYAQIRLKPEVRPDVRVLDGLRRHGIGYLEIRTLDLNPFSEVGIDSEQAHFIEVLLWAGALADSPELSGDERTRLTLEFRQISECGRDPGLVLPSTGAAVPESGEALCDALEPVADLLDAACDQSPHRQALDAARRRFSGKLPTLSEQVIEDAKQHGGLVALGNHLALRQRQRLLDCTSTFSAAPHEVQAAASRETLEQLRRQSAGQSFESYLQTHLLSRG